jgi:hypothetical protein
MSNAAPSSGILFATLLLGSLEAKHSFKPKKKEYFCIWMVVQFEKRRRRSLTPALGWSVSDNPGKRTKHAPTLKRVYYEANPCRVKRTS